MTPFLRIGPVDTVDGRSGEIRRLLGKAIRLWQDDEGRWCAMEMICRHQNADLSQGSLDGDIVTCPRHGWRYDLATGECLTAGWAGLRRYDVAVEDGILLLSVSPRDA